MKRREGKTGGARKPDEGRSAGKHEEPSGIRGAEGHPGEGGRRPDKITALEEKAGMADEYYDSLLRLKAEFDNFKKRSRKEMASARLHANQELILELLPVIDSFELGLESARRTRDFDKLVEGLEIALGELLQVLGKFGLNRVDAAGKQFDPDFHEAVTLIESDEHQDDSVVDEIRKGYLLHDRLLRPAMVTVARSGVRPLPGGEKEAGGTGEDRAVVQ